MLFGSSMLRGTLFAGLRCPLHPPSFAHRQRRDLILPRVLLASVGRDSRTPCNKPAGRATVLARLHLRGLPGQQRALPWGSLKLSPNKPPSLAHDPLLRIVGLLLHVARVPPSLQRARAAAQQVDGLALAVMTGNMAHCSNRCGSSAPSGRALS